MKMLTKKTTPPASVPASNLDLFLQPFPADEPEAERHRELLAKAEKIVSVYAQYQDIVPSARPPKATRRHALQVVVPLAREGLRIRPALQEKHAAKKQAARENVNKVFDDLDRELRKLGYSDTRHAVLSHRRFQEAEKARGEAENIRLPGYSEAQVELIEKELSRLEAQRENR